MRRLTSKKITHLIDKQSVLIGNSRELTDRFQNPHTLILLGDAYMNILEVHLRLDFEIFR